MTLTVEPHPARAESKPLSTLEVANRLGVKPNTVLAWITHGVPINGKRIWLRATRYGIRWKIKPEWLEEFAVLCSAPTEVNHVG